MTRARDLADSADKDIVGTITVDGLTVAGNVSVDGGTIKLDGNYPVGTNNVALGDGALIDTTSGSNNTSVGADSPLGDNTTGSYNAVMGTAAMRFSTTGSNNVAVGYQAMILNTTASNNTAVGYQAGYNNTTGEKNTSLGKQALFNTTTVNGNTGLGFLAGYTNVTGTFNTYVGMQAGYSATSGSNTFVGLNSGYYVTSGAANTILGRYNGNQGGLDIRTSSNNIVLSDGDGNPRITVNSNGDSYIKQNLRVGTAGAGNGIVDLNGRTGSYVVDYINSAGARRMVVVAGSGDLQNVNNSYGAISDVKLKENIIDASSQWEDIKALTVRKYSMKADNLEEPNQLGVIAQELEAAGINGLVSEAPDMDADNNDLGTTTKAVKYSILYMKAVKALQEAMDRIETLEAKVTALENA